MKCQASGTIINSNIIDCSAFHSDFHNSLEYITAHPYKNLNQFLTQATIASDHLPISLHEPLLDFYQRGNESGVLLLTSCLQEPDIDKIPTPQAISEKKSFVSESCLAMIAARLGQIFSYVQIDEGALFHNIVPKPGMELEQSFAGSLVELQFHTEQHFHPYSPDYLLLYCLRSMPEASTFFSSVRHMLAELDEQYHEILFEPLYRTGIDHVFGNTKTERGNGPAMPVLYGDHENPFLRYDQDLMLGETHEAQKALNALTSVLERVKESICLKPGDLLIVDNRRAVHGRSLFTPKFDGKDRWLQRAKVIRNLDRTAAACKPGEHIVRTNFFF